jgi:methionyl-tRNA formyltransferase
LKIVFFGTPEFAIPSIVSIIENGFDVCAVVTQPDKPRGRGNKVIVSAIKKYALEKEILIFQPQSANNIDFLHELQALKPDLFVTCAYGKILPKAILDIPKHGCINIHASLLPAYRGAGPIQWSIINGEKVTGITTMFTDIGLDTGDMLLKQEY